VKLYSKMSTIIEELRSFINKHFILVTSVLVLFAAKLFLQKRSNVKFEEYPGNKVVEVESMNDWNQMKSSMGQRLVVIDFFATWCPPCKSAAPVFGKLSTEYDDAQVMFLKVDVDKVGDLSKEFGVRSMPTFKLIKGGKQVDELVGWSEDRLRMLITQHIGVDKRK
jgi:thioredoxin 1